jgi:hypothetical protein
MAHRRGTTSNYLKKHRHFPSRYSGQNVSQCSSDILLLLNNLVWMVCINVTHLCRSWTEDTIRRVGISSLWQAECRVSIPGLFPRDLWVTPISLQDCCRPNCLFSRRHIHTTGPLYKGDRFGSQADCNWNGQAVHRHLAYGSWLCLSAILSGSAQRYVRIAKIGNKMAYWVFQSREGQTG